MRHLCCNDCSCRQSRQYLRAQSGVGFGACLHIHFTENLGEEFHAMVVIHRQELVVVLLLDFVRDGFSIDNGGHAILIFAFLISLHRRHFLHHDVTDFHFTPMRSLTIPTLVLINQGKVFTSHHGIALQHVTSDSLVLFQRKQPFLVLLLTLLQLLFKFGMQMQVDALLAIQCVHQDFVSKVVLDDAIQQFQALNDGHFLDGVGGEFLQFLICQVIHHVGIDAVRLNGQRLRILINDDAMRCQTLLPLLIGEIDRRGNQFLIRLGWLRASRAADGRHYDSLQIFQHILLLRAITLLLSLIIEPITAALQFARLHSAVPTFRHNRGFGEEQSSSNSAKMESLLTAWCPT